MAEVFDRKHGADSFVHYFLVTHSEQDEKIRTELGLVLAEYARVKAEKEALEKVFFLTKKRRQRLGALRTRTIQLQGRRTSLAASLADVMLREQYEALCEIPRVAHVEVKDSLLVIFTDMLYGKDEADEWRITGKYRIEIDFRVPNTTGVSWENLTHPTSNLQGPPNIGLDGRVTCMGTATEVLNKALAAKDWVTAVSIVVRYPECRGTRNQIKVWPVVPQSEVPEWYISAFGHQSAQEDSVNDIVDFYDM